MNLLNATLQESKILLRFLLGRALFYGLEKRKAFDLSFKNLIAPPGHVKFFYNHLLESAREG